MIEFIYYIIAWKEKKLSLNISCKYSCYYILGKNTVRDEISFPCSVR